MATKTEILNSLEKEDTSLINTSQKNLRGKRARVALQTYYLYAPENWKNLLSGMSDNMKYNGLYFMHLIIEARRRIINVKDFVPVSKERFTKIISPHAYPSVWRYFSENSIIECTRYIMPRPDDGIDGRSRSYKLSEKCSQKIVRVKIDNQMYVKKLIKFREDTAPDEAELDDIQRGIFANVKRAVMHKAYSKRFDWACDDYGRCHWQGTNMLKEHRKKTTLDGKNLVEIDIANSQPLFISAMWMSGGGQRNQFVGDCEDGLLYNKIGADDESKKEVKKAFFTYIYGPNEIDNEVSRRFKSMYPDIANWIYDIKETQAYAKFATDMQKCESDLMIRCVCAQCIDLEIPFLPIHDCLMVHPENVKTVSNIIKEAFNRIDIKCTLTVG